MPTLPPPSVPVSQLGRAVTDLGMAGLLGGTLFGRLALHPAVAEISDERERGKVVNAAWQRFGAINAVSLAALVTGWAGARAGESADRNLSPRERRLSHALDGLVAAATVTGLATMVEGIRFSRTARDGAVPLTDGDHTAPGATRRQAQLKRRLNVLGLVSLGVDAGVVAVNAALAQENFRRPPARRLRPGLRR